jgi:hypothetical protein
MEKTVKVEDVSGFRTKSGNIRFVLRDEEGNEYTTFKEPIGARALELEGKGARIKFHEAERDGFRNVYLDAIEPVQEDEGEAEVEGAVEEVAWKTAIEAAPYLLGERKRAVPPDDLYDRVKPFKDLVAEDIREGSDE